LCPRLFTLLANDVVAVSRRMGELSGGKRHRLDALPAAGSASGALLGRPVTASPLKPGALRA
jgi:hypothetical protein